MHAREWLSKIDAIDITNNAYNIEEIRNGVYASYYLYKGEGEPFPEAKNLYNPEWRKTHIKSRIVNYILEEALLGDLAKILPDNVMRDRPGFALLILNDSISEGLRPSEIQKIAQRHTTTKDVDAYIQRVHSHELLPEAINITGFFTDMRGFVRNHPQEDRKIRERLQAGLTKIIPELHNNKEHSGNGLEFR